MTVQNLYTQYLDGKITKQKFLYEVRRDQNLTMISPNNSFDDVVKILKNKSIISEKASKESTGKQEVDIIAKTIDMVNPYEYAKGMKLELDMIDVPTRTDLTEEEVLKAQKKVLANLTKNPSYYTEKMYGKVKFDGDDTVEINKKSIDALDKGKKNVIREGVDTKTRFDVTLRNGKHFSGVTFINKNSFNTPNGGTYINQDIEKVTPSDNQLGEETPTKPGYHADGTPKSNEEMSDDEREAFYNDSDFINESYNPFPMNEKQEAVLQRYAESTGIPLDNLKNMVAEAKSKKKQSSEPVMEMDEFEGGTEAFEDDNEPHELHILLSQLAKNAIELAKDLRELEAEGVDNLPQWFQAKIIIAKNYIEGAREYLEGEMGNELDEGETAKTNDATHNAAVLQQINQVPNAGAKAELTKAFNSGQAINI